MSNIYRVRIRGDLACFTRPEFKVERVSYEVITPSAARGVLEAIFWKPSIRWVIRRILVLSPPRFIQIRRNELRDRVSVANARRSMRDGRPRDFFADDPVVRDQRNTLALRDIDYAIEADFRMTARQGPDDNQKKLDAMFRRRLDRGQCHMQPYLGCREFPAIVEPYTGSPPPLETETRDLGLMLHDLRYGINGNEPVFFCALLDRGVIEVPDWEHAA